MSKLSKRDSKRIIELLQAGENIPLDYKNILFPPEKREYELVYAGKEREEDILANTMAVPLQPVKTFGKNGKGWTNKLIFGDNLQVMKNLLDDPEVKGRVKLIYIDPPFATKQEFRGSQDQKAYQDKIAGARFIEFLRKRLIFLRELLADDGSIYVHLDWKKIHYVKTIMDETFRENNFLNEVVWYYRRWNIATTLFARNHDTLLYYAKTSGKHIFNNLYIPKSSKSSGSGKAWQSVIGEDGIRRSVLLDKQSKGVPMPDMWEISMINPVGLERTLVDYPTQKPEELLGRILSASTNPGDLVLDAFAGSGTTCAVAEKLGRRWIGIDCGKLAVYTIQKRLLNLKSEIGNKGKKINPKPFTLYNAGLYDFPKLKKLPWQDWRIFALHLFNCRDNKHTVSGIDLDGYKGRADVLVFNHQQDGGVVLDYGFIDDLHSMLGTKSGKQFFIIAPAASVTFLEDYIDKGNTRYYILRIPYSIINELHKRDFEAIRQPIDETQVNDTVDAVGFDFIRPPKVECEYFKKSDFGVIKIKTFKSEAMTKGASTLDNRESLSMVMVDFNYDGETFNLEKVYYASDIEKNKWEIHCPVASIKNQLMIVYLDIYGNEYREIKTLKDFKRSGNGKKAKGGKQRA
ncbi:MAG: site-specific DNA-methyltransferase [bacterium]